VRSFFIAAKVRNERRKKSSRRRARSFPRALMQLNSIQRMKKKMNTGRRMSSMGSHGMKEMHIMMKNGMAGMVRNGVAKGKSSKKIRPGVLAV